MAFPGTIPLSVVSRGPEVVLSVSPLEGFCLQAPVGQPVLTGLGLVELLRGGPLCPKCRSLVRPDMASRLTRIWSTPLEERARIPWHVWLHQSWLGWFALDESQHRVLSDLVLFIGDCVLDRLDTMEKQMGPERAARLQWSDFSSSAYLEGLVDSMGLVYATLDCLRPAGMAPSQDFSRN